MWAPGAAEGVEPLQNAPKESSPPTNTANLNLILYKGTGSPDLNVLNNM